MAVVRERNISLGSLLVCMLYLSTCCATPEVRVKAVLVPCGTESHASKMGSTVDAFLSSKPTLTKCQRKLGVVLQINNTGKVMDEDMYVFLDEAVDEASGVTVKLVEPLVFKVYQHPVSLAHTFHYLGSVNGKLMEATFTASNLSSSESLAACFSNDLTHFKCGYDRTENFPMGFCCPCTHDDCDPNAREKPCRPLEETPTTHCLQQSPFWYFVTALGPPMLYHTLEIHIYQRRKSSSWQAITKKPGIILGTDLPAAVNKENIVAAKYLTHTKYSSLDGGLPYQTHRLLIPHATPGMSADELPPHMANSARDYLIFPTSMVELGDSECGKIGTYFKAFSNQGDRCRRPVGSCLELQPLDLWSQDNAKREDGKDGKYLLENFATPQENAVVVNTLNGNRYLNLEYQGEFSSLSFVEINADAIEFDTARFALIEVNTLAMVNPIVIQLHIVNKHHRAELYKAYIKGCSFGFSSTSTDDVYLAPQEKHLLLLILRMDAGMPTTDVWCNVAIETSMHADAVTQSVLVRPRGTCNCYMDCQCTCLGESMACTPDISHTREKRKSSWHAADKPTEPLSHFKVPEPFIIDVHKPSVSMAACGLSAFLWALQIAIMIGFIKAVLGLIFPSVGLWGMEFAVLSEPKPIGKPRLKTKEPQKDFPHMNDEGDKPVNTAAVFCVNVFCFCFLPCILWNMIQNWKDSSPGEAFRDITHATNDNAGRKSAVKKRTDTA
ncbi:uncharacterized protein LOC135401295 isoform X2 [Ornithodoros turicata]|uniref:uncharacterized protein LOC135401295 isoform X2 n=1 Tax=Ornithodoros turicata TaxID=34597 RepID=UPI0031395E4B